MSNIFENMFLSKEEKERRYREYLKKLFPYGENQKQKVQEIVSSLTSKKNAPQLMMHYVLIKEAMIDSESKDYDAVAAKIEKKNFVKLTPELKTCIKLLILKDLEIDENLNYPTCDELKAEAAGKINGNQ